MHHPAGRGAVRVGEVRADRPHLNDAKRLFREKVKYAYDKLPKEIRAVNPASNDSSGELVFKEGGSLYVSTSYRH